MNASLHALRDFLAVRPPEVASAGLGGNRGLGAGYVLVATAAMNHARLVVDLAASRMGVIIRFVRT